MQARQALAQARALSEQDSSRLAELSGELERDQPILEEARGRSDATAAGTAGGRNGHARLAGRMGQVQSGGQRTGAAGPGGAYPDQPPRAAGDCSSDAALRATRKSGTSCRMSRCRPRSSSFHAASLEGEAGLLAVRERVETRIRSITSLRERSQQAQEELAGARAEMQTLKGRLASLQALQQAARGEGDKEVEQWLGSRGLGTASRLLETLEVSGEWQKAAEVVLAEQLQAVMVEGLDGPAAQIMQLEHGSLGLFETAPGQTPARAGTLAERVKGPGPLTDLLNSILTAGDLDEALRRRGELAAGECLVTPEGVRVGRGWVSLQRGSDARAGVLAREQEIRGMLQRQAEIEPQLEQLAVQLAEDRQALVEAEQEREVQQRELEAAQRVVAEVRALLSGKRARAEQIRHRLEGLEADADELREQVEQGTSDMALARTRLHQALALDRGSRPAA